MKLFIFKRSYGPNDKQSIFGSYISLILNIIPIYNLYLNLKLFKTFILQLLKTLPEEINICIKKARIVMFSKADKDDISISF